MTNRLIRITLILALHRLYIRHLQNIKTGPWHLYHDFTSGISFIFTRPLDRRENIEFGFSQRLAMQVDAYFIIT